MSYEQLKIHVIQKTGIFNNLYNIQIHVSHGFLYYSKIHQKIKILLQYRRKHMRKFRKYTATALVAMMVAGMTMSGYQPADVSASQESEYIIVTKDKKSMKTVESKYNTMIDTQEQNTDFLKDENVLVSK